MGDMMTKEEKTAKLQEIEEQVEDFYTEDEAVALVNGILEPWSPLCRLSFGEDAFKITYSYMVKSWRDRHLICAILAHHRRDGAQLRESCRPSGASITLRSDCTFSARSARDVDLDYTRDPRWPVRAVTAVLDWLDIE